MKIRICSREAQFNSRRSLFRVMPLILMLLVTGYSVGQETKTPPATRVDNVKEVLHGVEIADAYRWLEDQEGEETRAWIETQNTFTDSILGDLPQREELKALLTKLMKVDSIGVPMERGGRYFITKRLADQDLAVVYIREGIDGKDEILIDPHTMSEDHSVSVNVQTISNDGKLLAYGVRKGGADEVEIRIFDVDARKDLPDVLPRARNFGINFAPDNSGFFYTRHTMLGGRVYFHKFGTDTKEDKEIFGKGYTVEKIIFSILSPDGRWLAINVLHGSAARKTEIHLIDLDKGFDVVTVAKDLDGRFFGGVVEGKLLMQTTWNAPNGRILITEAENPAQENWRELVPEREDVYIQSVTAAGGHVFVNFLKDVQSHVEMYNPDGTKIREIAFDTIGTVSNMAGRWGSKEAFFVFASFHIPTTIYRYDIKSGEKKIWSKVKVPIDGETFEIKQVWYNSKDGTRIPMFIVHREGLSLDGTNPTILTGYGGFNLSLTPGFTEQGAAWAERGGVFAIPNLRGGGEFGEKWHRAGMLESKQNVFDDFIAAAEYLIDKGYTSPKHLAITGGSNGGLLVGAAMTQRPDLFRAVVCTYPLLDMLRYHKFLVARFWVPEYGSSEDAEQFKYILEYSPYHNVKKGTKYPSVLFITGDADTRVAPLHARKMCALLQAGAGPEDLPVMIRYHTKAGHSGGRPLSERIEDATESLSFLLWQLSGK